MNAIKGENKMKKIFIICPVRDADSETKQRLEDYAAGLEKEGHRVHLPHRDTDQSDTIGYKICLTNMVAIKHADEVHVFYTNTSTGTHFDLGMAFALCKNIVIVDIAEPYEPNKKSFPRMMKHWEFIDIQNSVYTLIEPYQEKS